MSTAENATAVTLSPLLFKKRSLWIPLAVGSSVLSLMPLTPDQRHLALPALAAANVAIAFLVLLRNRETAVPLEIGSIYMAAVSLYAIAPLAGFLVSGMAITELSDNRLLRYQPSERELGAFAWRYVVYLASFGAAYLFARGKRTVHSVQPLGGPGKSVEWSAVGLLAIFTSYFLLLNAFFGMHYSPSYEKAGEAREAIAAMPYLLHQVSGHLYGMLFVLKLGGLIFLFRRFRVKSWRVVLYSWLLAEILATLLKMGERRNLLLLLMSAVIMYHRLVKPVKLSILVPAGVVALAGFLAFGVARDYRAAIEEGDTAAITASNEFQAVFATAYDLHQRAEEGSLKVPWQVYANDLIALLPSQMLPFEKSDNATWYLDLIGLRDSGVGYTFGAISESVVGLGWPELFLRGTLIGFIFAAVHRWYSRRRSNFWALLLYIWLCAWCYQSFRVTSFYLLVLLVYRVAPVFGLLWAGTMFLDRIGKRRTSTVREVSHSG